MKNEELRSALKAAEIKIEDLKLDAVSLRAENILLDRIIERTKEILDGK